MAVTKFQSEKWSALVELQAQESSIVNSVASKLYQADASGSKIIHTTTIRTPTIAAYSGTLSYEALTDDDVEIALDKKFSFAFKVDDIDVAQSQADMKNPAIKQAGLALALKADNEMFKLYASAGHQINDGAGTPGALAINSANVESMLLDVKQWFDEHNVMGTKALVISPALDNKITLASLKREGALSDSVFQNGYSGKLFGMDVYVSNQLPAGHALAFSDRALPFASQINKVETLRLQDSFADAIRGLYTFGGAVKWADEFVDIWYSITTES